MNCPCGSGRPYDDCCGALHRDERVAATAEELMRSRYSAFALGDAVYLLATWHPSTRPKTLTLDDRIEWLRLRILDADDADDGAGPAAASERTVEFRAVFRTADGRDQLHERSRFVREAGRWYYLGGDILG